MWMLMCMHANLCMYVVPLCQNALMKYWTLPTDTRGRMQHFWKAHSVELSTKEMMLDEDADALGLEEIPEMLSLLPDLAGKDVIELGAGIGYVARGLTLSLDLEC